MRHFITTLIILLAMFSATASGEETLVVQTPQESGIFYQNPNEDIYIYGYDVADPTLFLDDDGMYYCYPSSGTIEGFMVWSSPDMVNWTGHGYCFQRTEDHWASDSYWAPGMTKHDGKYYLSYSARDRKSQLYRIAIAVSDSPLGPYTDINADKPLGGFTHLPNHAIDAELFFDDDGRAYMFYSNDWQDAGNGNRISECYVVRLTPNLSAADGAPTLVASPDASWDTLRSPIVDERCIYNEAPSVIKHDGKYYVLFSGNHFDERQYSVGYAVADSPLGPYTKYKLNPVLYTEDVWEDISGTGHNGWSATADGRECFIMYHTHYSAILRGGNRIINIDRMGFREDGSVYVNGPTRSWQPLPSAEGEPHNIAGEAALTVDSLTEQQLELLTDGEFTLHTKFRQYEADLPAGETTVLNFTFEEPRALRAVMLYVSSDLALGLKSCTVQIGDLEPEEMEITYEYNGQGILCFEEVAADSVAITIEASDYIGAEAAISEVTIIGN